jgi:peptidoglycan/LPS O-acetylase OafA/YrhL
MPSRDSELQIVVVAAVLASLVALSFVGVQLDGPEGFAVWALFNLLVFGGGHLLLALRGEGGSVPVRSRWRYVGTLVVVFGVAPLVAYATDTLAVGVDGEVVGIAVAGLAVGAFVVTEAASGYRESRPQ